MTTSKGGQPTKYDPIFPNELIAEGLHSATPWTDDQIAARFGVCGDTVRTWKKRHPAFKAACSLCKQRANAILEHTAFEVANGYERETVKVIGKQQPDGTVRPDRVEKERRYFAPDTQILKLLLMNRMPEKYRDVRKLEMTGKDGWPVQFIIKVDADDAGV